MIYNSPAVTPSLWADIKTDNCKMKNVDYKK